MNDEKLSMRGRWRLWVTDLHIRFGKSKQYTNVDEMFRDLMEDE